MSDDGIVADHNAIDPDEITDFIVEMLAYNGNLGM